MIANDQRCSKWNEIADDNDYIVFTKQQDMLNPCASKPIPGPSTKILLNNRERTRMTEITQAMKITAIATISTASRTRS